MNRKALLLCALISASLTALQAADLISFREISMLLRNGEDQQFIIKDTARRKLLQPLTAEELQTLQSLHASPALINVLRDPATVAPTQTAAAYTARLEQQKAQALKQAQEDQLAAQAAAQAREQQLLKAAQPPAKPPTEANATGSQFIGKPLTLKFNAVDGSPVDLSKLHGKVVLVDFWATWCGPCMKEMPNVLAAYEKYRGKGFEIVGVSLDKDKDSLLRITKQKGMSWPQYFDGKGWNNEIATQFGIRSIPSMWLVDKNGIIATTDAWGKLDAEVARLLAQ